MLSLEIELLTGIYRASLPDGSGAEWPPHPERVYSALVQSWSDGGCMKEERTALEWLEGRCMPLVEASQDAAERDAPTVFVPPNDPSGADEATLPERRRRQARNFRATCPADPLVRMWWDCDPDAAVLAALIRLSLRVASLGHSTSLVRFTFSHEPAPLSMPCWRPDLHGRAVLRAPYSGRLADLERWYASVGARGRLERPRSRRFERYAPPTDGSESRPAPRTVFGGLDRWFVFEDAGGFRPDLVAFGHVSRRMRDALMSVAPQPPPEMLSGHGPGGAPSARPHLAIVPLANVGWSHATGDLLGFAVVLPRESDPSERDAAIRAMAAFVQVGRAPEQGTLQLASGRAWKVERSPVPSRTSLAPDRWCAISRSWASATPVFLDRFLDGEDPLAEARVVAAACTNIGLPEPSEIEIHKHSAVEAAPSAYLLRSRGARVDWTFPQEASYRQRPRRHVVLRFSEPVEGPVILGAGRYHGFGLCLPIDSETRR